MGRSDEPAIAAEALRFAWGGAAAVIDVPSLVVGRGEKVLIAGPSGSGKSTLLGLVGGVLRPDAGRLEVLGTDLRSMRGAAVDAWRADHVGFVFQLFNLLPWLSLAENVLLPCRFSAARRRRAEAAGGNLRGEAYRLLARLGLDDQSLHARDVAKLSVGQQQRVAAARALIGQPPLLIADEPTSSLDADARQEFLRLLMDECEAAGSTLLFVTHDTGLAGLFDRALHFADLNRAAGAS